MKDSFENDIVVILLSDDFTSRLLFQNYNVIIQSNVVKFQRKMRAEVNAENNLIFEHKIKEIK